MTTRRRERFLFAVFSVLPKAAGRAVPDAFSVSLKTTRNRRKSSGMPLACIGDTARHIMSSVFPTASYTAAGNENLVRLTQGFDARSHIDHVTKNILGLDNARSRIDANTNMNLLAWPGCLIISKQGLLQLTGGPYCHQRVIKTCHNCIPDGFYDPSLMFFDNGKQQVIVHLHHEPSFDIATGCKECSRVFNIGEQHRYLAGILLFEQGINLLAFLQELFYAIREFAGGYC